MRGRVSLKVHRRFLRRFVAPGSRVLEVGAGPGRFTLELAAIGARVVVTDFSEVPLGLNEAQLRGTDAEQHVQRRELLDVCDTSRYADGVFTNETAGSREEESLPARLQSAPVTRKRQEPSDADRRDAIVEREINGLARRAGRVERRVQRP